MAICTWHCDPSCVSHVYPTSSAGWVDDRRELDNLISEKLTNPEARWRATTRSRSETDQRRGWNPVFSEVNLQNFGTYAPIMWATTTLEAHELSRTLKSWSSWGQLSISDCESGDVSVFR